jgi:hypothetical protein
MFFSLDGGEWSVHHSGHFIAGTYCIQDWVGVIVSLHMVMTKFCLLLVITYH